LNSQAQTMVISKSVPTVSSVLSVSSVVQWFVKIFKINEPQRTPRTLRFSPFWLEW